MLHPKYLYETILRNREYLNRPLAHLLPSVNKFKAKERVIFSDIKNYLQSNRVTGYPIDRLLEYFEEQFKQEIIEYENFYNLHVV